MEHIFDYVHFISIKKREDIVFNCFTVSRVPNTDFDPLEMRATQMIDNGFYAFMPTGARSLDHLYPPNRKVNIIMDDKDIARLIT